MFYYQDHMGIRTYQGHPLKISNSFKIPSKRVGHNKRVGGTFLSFM